MTGTLIRQSSVAGVMRGLGAICAYLMVVGLGRTLAAQDFGYMAATLSLTLVMSACVGLGYPTAMMRTLGQATAQARLNDARAALSQAVRICLLSSGAVTVLALGGAVVLWEGAPRLGHLALGLCLVPGFVLTDLHGAVLRSTNRIIAALAPRDILWRLGVIGLGAGVGAALPPGGQFVPLLGLSAAWLGAIVVAQARAAWRSLPRRNAQRPVPSIDTTVVRRIWGTNVAGMGLRNLDVICVAVCLSPAEAGVYFAAAKTASLTVFALNAVNTVIGPRLAALHAANDTNGMARELRIGAALAFGPAAVGGGLIILAGPTLLRLFGDAGAAQLPVLFILSAAQILSALCACAGTFLNMTGHEAVHMRISLGWLLCGAVAMILAAYLGDSLGVACAAGITLAGHDLTLWGAAWLKTGYDSSALSWLPGVWRRGRP